MKVIKICMFCGKDHKGKKPQACLFKGAVATALFKTLQSHEAMFILDRTRFLKNLETAMKNRGLLKAVRK